MTFEQLNFRQGSSPRMRGAQHSRTTRGILSRIIPAYAGSTLIQAIPSV